MFAVHCERVTNDHDNANYSRTSKNPLDCLV